MIVAMMSWWPSTSAREFGRYFSTLIRGQFTASTPPDRYTDHGKVSSASTGRLAALLLPFFASPPKLIEVSATGASTSISSSISDILLRRSTCSHAKATRRQQLQAVAKLLLLNEDPLGNDDACWEDATDALIGTRDLRLRLLMSTPGPSPPLLPKRAKSLSAACPLVSCHCHHRQPDPTKAPHTTTAAAAYLQDACKH